MNTYILKFYRVEGSGYIPAADTMTMSRKDALYVKEYCRKYHTFQKPSEINVRVEYRELQVIDGVIYAPMKIAGSGEYLRKHAPQFLTVDVDDRY